MSSIFQIVFILIMTLSGNEMAEYYQIDPNMTYSDWPDVYSDYCGYKCSNGFKVRTKTGTYCPNNACFNCSCSGDCLSKRTCCPSYSQNKINGRQEESNFIEKMNVHDAFNRAICKTTLKKDKVLTVVKCPRSWKDETVGQQCEDTRDGTPWAYLNDVRTGLVFRNIYCAMCNGFALNPHTPGISLQPHGNNVDISESTLYAVDCDSFNDVVAVIDRIELYKFAHDFRQCELSYHPSINIIKCDGVPASLNKVFSSCPMNTKTILRDLCHNLPAVPALMVKGSKNIFCALCNTILTVHLEDPFDLLCSGDNFVPSFGLLFGRGTGARLESMICESDQKSLNKQTGCFPLSCPIGKVTKNDHVSCETALDEIRGLLYHFSITIRPEPMISKDSLKTISNYVRRTLLSQKSVGFKDFTYVISESKCGAVNYNRGHQNEIELKGYIKAPKRLSRDDFENGIIEHFVTNSWRILVTDTSGEIYNVSLHKICIGKEICDIFRSQSEPKNCSSYSKDEIRIGKLEVKEYDRYLEIAPTVTCPYVLITTARMFLVVNKIPQMLFKIDNKEINIVWNSSNMFYENGLVYICVPFYKHIVQELEKSTHHSNSVIVIINAYLDIVCVLVSSLLLAVSIVTYFLFPTLRTVPGLNTLCLCLCLLTAQVSLVVTSVVGGQGILTEIHCVVHGVILHYSWVASFTWMNTCCVHMYRVFTGKATGSNKKLFMWNCVYSFGFPFLVCLGMFVITIVLTKGKSIAYDKHACFLDTHPSILIIIMGVLFPLFLSVTINAILFMLTMKEIISIRRLKKERSRSEQGIITYVKLSAVTGLSCLITATAIQFDNQILSLMASPVAGLQGVFIFLSFTANGRVLKLYADLISRTKSHFCSSTPDVKKDNLDTNLAK